MFLPCLAYHCPVAVSVTLPFAVVVSSVSDTSILFPSPTEITINTALDIIIAGILESHPQYWSRICMHAYLLT
jgi:hypothetical protein